MSLNDYVSARRHAEEEVAVTARAENVTLTNRVAALADRAEVTFAAGDYALSLPETQATLDACVRALGAQAESCFVMRRQLAFMLLRIQANGAAMKLVSALDEEAANTSSPARQIQAQSIALRVVAANSLPDDRSTALDARLKPTLALILRLTGYMALAEAAARRGDSARAAHYLDAVAAEPEKIPMIFVTRAAMIRGVVEQEQSRPSDALRTIEQATKAYAAEFGIEHTQTILCGLNAVAPLLAIGEVAEAHRRIDVALARLKDRLPADAPLFTLLGKLRNQPIATPANGSLPSVFFN